MIVNYLVVMTLLRHQYPTVAHILTHSVNLTFSPKSGFKNKCRVQAWKWGPFTTLEPTRLSTSSVGSAKQQLLIWDFLCSFQTKHAKPAAAALISALGPAFALYEFYKPRVVFAQESVSGKVSKASRPLFLLAPLRLQAQMFLNATIYALSVCDMLFLAGCEAIKLKHSQT